MNMRKYCLDIVFTNSLIDPWNSYAFNINSNFKLNVKCKFYLLMKYMW